MGLTNRPGLTLVDWQPDALLSVVTKVTTQQFLQLVLCLHIFVKIHTHQVMSSKTKCSMLSVGTKLHRGP